MITAAQLWTSLILIAIAAGGIAVAVFLRQIERLNR